jgi:hypothetical protein
MAESIMSISNIIKVVDGVFGCEEGDAEGMDGGVAPALLGWKRDG